MKKVIVAFLVVAGLVIGAGAPMFAARRDVIWGSGDSSR